MERYIMNCQACQIELPAYVDGSTPPHLRRALQAHLRTCVACADALAGERRALMQIAPVLAPVTQARRLSPAARARLAAAGRAGGQHGLPGQKITFSREHDKREPHNPMKRQNIEQGTAESGR